MKSILKIPEINNSLMFWCFQQLHLTMNHHTEEIEESEVSIFFIQTTEEDVTYVTVVEKQKLLIGMSQQNLNKHFLQSDRHVN